MDSILQDVRYALRSYARSPGFTLLTALTLALGIGATTAIFSAVNALLLRPLPYESAERLYIVGQNQSLLDFDDIRGLLPSVEASGCVTYQPLDDTGGVEPVQILAALTDRGLFETLGARPLLGRTFDEKEDAAGGERAVVLSYGYWQKRFGGDAGVLGRGLLLSGNPYTVVGVLPPGFALPERAADVYAPLRVVNPNALKFRGIHFLRLYLRLAAAFGGGAPPPAPPGGRGVGSSVAAAGVPLERARSEMEVAARRLAEIDPIESAGRNLSLVPLRERIAGPARPALLLLLAAAGLVLLVAAGNFANLLLARALSRRREVTIRASLGAGRGRIVRQLLTESLLLALFGGGVGLLLAPWLVRVLVALSPPRLPAIAPIEVDGTVVAFALGLTLLVGTLFGLVPAWSTTRLALSLSEGGRSGTAGPSRSRAAALLVVGELALAVVLVVASGLLVKTFRGLRSVEPGFRSEGVVTMRVELPEARYGEAATQVEFRRRLFEAAESVPGLSLAAVSEIPLTGESLTHNVAVEGHDIPAGEDPELVTRSVAGDYFRVMGIPILKGRAFTRDDRPGAPPVGIANEAMIREHFAGQDPLGRRVRWSRQDPPQWITIVGVARDVRHFGLDSPDQPALYTPYDQAPVAWKRWMVLVARRGQAGSGNDTHALTAVLKQALAGIDRDLPVTRVASLGEVVARSLEVQRFHMALFGLFGALALVLAACGIYGVLAHAVSERTKEIGIRMALGAARREVLRLVIGQGMQLSLAGISLGVFLALTLTRLLGSFLYGVSPTDLPTFASLTLFLGLVALAACAVPAARATRVEPVAALREE